MLICSAWVRIAGVDTAVSAGEWPEACALAVARALAIWTGCGLWALHIIAAAILAAVPQDVQGLGAACRAPIRHSALAPELLGQIVLLADAVPIAATIVSTGACGTWSATLDDCGVTESIGTLGAEAHLEGCDRAVRTTVAAVAATAACDAHAAGALRVGCAFPTAETMSAEIERVVAGVVCSHTAAVSWAYLRPPRLIECEIVRWSYPAVITLVTRLHEK
jgi:hypothetical protein